jgi:hypothetical protein
MYREEVIDQFYMVKESSKFRQTKELRVKAIANRFSEEFFNRQPLQRSQIVPGINARFKYGSDYLKKNKPRALFEKDNVGRARISAGRYYPTSEAILSRR